MAKYRTIKTVFMLSIIIINYNTFQLTVECINSIKKSIISDYEIILIDNASKDHPPKDFLTIFPSIKLIELNENVGFGRANNIGMQQAQGEYFLLLNSDTIIKEDALDKCLSYLKTHSNIDILGCRAEFPNGITQLTAFQYEGEHSLIRSIIYFIKRNSTVQYANQLYKKWKKEKNAVLRQEQKKITEPTPNFAYGKRIGSLSGVFMMFNRKVYDETRGFDPDFFMYYEETEWFINRIYNRYTILYYPYASIIHYCGQSDVHGAMSTQFWVSSALFWYKISHLHLFFYSLFLWIDIPCNLFNYVFSGNKNYIVKIKQIWTTLKFIPVICRFSNSFNGRNAMLKVKIS
ncbi:MAG: glycosyltransferase family 2 protein [Flavobacteriaceae bacterium]|jgi:GT2 family glycosyltransferase|nr:glycosyltransferase family 2 protein [Flavobacteriaceae bacterium]